MRHILLGAAVLLTACTPDDTDPAPTATERFSVPGPHDVGHLATEITYTPVGADEARTLAVEVWYPAEADGSEPSADYAVAGIAQVEAPLAVSGAAVAGGGPFPVAVYSHGSGGLGLLAYPFAERFASHGWLVVAPDHTGNTSLDLVTGSSDPFTATATFRPQDITATLDAAEDGLSDALADAADTDAVFLWGHSFGGYTTYANGGASVSADVLGGFCDQVPDDPSCVFLEGEGVQTYLAEGTPDDRIDALGPQAPAILGMDGPSAFDDLDLPTLLMSSGGDITTPDASNADLAWDWRSHPGDAWLQIPNGGHYSYISICLDLDLSVIELFQQGALDDGCGEDFAPIGPLLDVHTTYMLGFAHDHVLGEADAATVVDGPALSDEVVVVRP